MTGAVRQGQTYPVTHKQRYLLEQHVHPDCTDDLRAHWTISSAVLVRPRVDLRRLRRAAQKLLARHDSLRLRFEPVAGDWQARIDPLGADQIRQIDLGDLDDAAFDARIKEIANAPMEIIGVPLIDFVIARCGSRGDVGIARVHHSILDGYGAVVLAEDFIKLLLGMPLTEPALSFVQYLKHHELPAPDRKAQIDAFWRQMHQDLPKNLAVGRRAKGRAPLMQGFGATERRQIAFRAQPDSIAGLETYLADTGLSKVSVFYAAYLEALCQCYDLPQVMFRTHIPDPNPALDRYIGDRTLDPILTYRRMGDQDFTQAARQLGLTLAQAIAHFPAEAVIRSTPYEKALIEAGHFTDQFSAYQPRATARQNRSMFSGMFSAQTGRETQIGPYKLTLLDISIPKRILYEMQLDLGTSAVTTGFTILYDGLAFDAEEVRRIGHKICDLLALELSDETAA